MSSILTLLGVIAHVVWRKDFFIFPFKKKTIYSTLRKLFGWMTCGNFFKMCLFAFNQKWNNLLSCFRPFSGLLTKAEMKAYLEVQMILILKIDYLGTQSSQLRKSYVIDTKTCHFIYTSYPLFAISFTITIISIIYAATSPHLTLQVFSPPPLFVTCTWLFPPFHITCCSISVLRQDLQVFPAQSDSISFRLHKCRPAQETSPDWQYLV